MSGVSISSTMSRCCEWMPNGVATPAVAAAAAAAFAAAARPRARGLVFEPEPAAAVGARDPGPARKWLDELSTKVKPSKVSSFEVTLCPSCWGGGEEGGYARSREVR